MNTRSLASILSTRAVLSAVAVLGMALLAGPSFGQAPGAGAGGSVASLSVASAAFAGGEAIPRRYTGEGDDTSPPLSWEGAPDGTAELALICDDPDAPSPRPWVHWVLYGIPADRKSLAEGDDAGAVEGKNSWGTPGYRGPMPPSGHGVHRYVFKLYALDQPLGLAPGAGKQQVLDAMEGHVLARGELIGTYERR